ncbi:hypothetical protein ACUN7V_14470, partial [Quadrisphaera oryzae]
MGQGPVSRLEERIAAHLWWRSVAHPDGYELASDTQVLHLEEDDDDERSAAAAPALLPEACLVGVREEVALLWAARVPGVGLVAAVEELWADLAADLPAACCSTDTTDSACPGVSDAELVEAVAACERQLAALAARRDQLAGVFASRRQAEAEADVADARAASARDGTGRPWAMRVRSTAPSELCARLGIGSVASEALVERGLAAVGAHRDVASAMAAGALPAGAGSWLLEQLSAVRTTSYLSALESESAARERALEAQRAAEDAARAQAGLVPLTREEVRARAAADRAQVDAEAEAAAAAHAEQVAAAVRRELLGKATGTAAWTAAGAGQDLARTDAGDAGDARTDGDGGDEEGAPQKPAASATTRPTAGAGLGPNRRAWTKRLNTAVARADGPAAQRRAAKARAACSTSRWS